ncbi:MAG TPA: hypothetical protein VNL18_15525 [Gemmatimonadales bacterium]|nr:hypothetical protein [Gemmatimonadales bacterium]
MRSLSETFDLLDSRTPSRHAFTKVTAFATTLAVLVIVAANLLWGRRPLNGAEALLLAACLVAPYGLNGFRTFLALRQRGLDGPV